ncbi:hypothetical protein J6590_016011 [Homalodisca vitripennis]|nr:hypothetical protein J6590_016007 [Homalodisca vitripennis]KAG8312825.1 hypothetical protein J6590_016011 [Homalodisca vitripennis]
MVQRTEYGGIVRRSCQATSSVLVTQIGDRWGPTKQPTCLWVTFKQLRVQLLSQQNQVKLRRAWLLLGRLTAERSCLYKQPACPAIGGGSAATYKRLGPRLSVRESFFNW